MKVSVLIPTYNSKATIRATLDSVLQQTHSPAEILVMDDGSTDETFAILESYKPRVFLFQQRNRGVAAARNALCRRASGDLIAFLDHDDLWHPRYLETQCKLYADYPDAAAFFTGHVDFRGYGNHEWIENPLASKPTIEIIHALSFLNRYNRCPGLFASMSYCCIPRTMMEKIGESPFAVAVSGADDFCLCNRFPLLGSVVHTSAPLVAYRIIKEAQSADRLKGVGLSIRSFEILYQQYNKQGNRRLALAFLAAFASKKRVYAKMLMGAGRFAEAKDQLLDSLKFQAGAVSFIKSAGLFCLIQLPVVLHPEWPASHRAE
jgi:glycosyltransferase involved in cell wall biosynthesis